MAEHTPGPWQTRFIYRILRRVRESPGDILISSHPENDWGDACLMAASPDLLAGCRAFVKAMRDSAMMPAPEPMVRSLIEAMMIVVPAIAKAEDLP